MATPNVEVIRADRALKALINLALGRTDSIVVHRRGVQFLSYDRTIGAEVPINLDISERGYKLPLPESIKKNDIRRLEKILINEDTNIASFVFRHTYMDVPMEVAEPYKFRNIPVDKAHFFTLTDTHGPIDEIVTVKFSDFNECVVISFENGMFRATGETTEAEFEVPGIYIHPTNVVASIPSYTVDEFFRVIKMFGPDHVDVHPAGGVEDKVVRVVYFSAVMKDKSSLNFYVGGDECSERYKEWLKEEEEKKKRMELVDKFEQEELPKLKEKLVELERAVDDYLSNPTPDKTRAEQIFGKEGLVNLLKFIRCKAQDYYECIEDNLRYANMFPRSVSYWNRVVDCKEDLERMLKFLTPLKGGRFAENLIRAMAEMWPEARKEAKTYYQYTYVTDDKIAYKAWEKLTGGLINLDPDVYVRLAEAVKEYANKTIPPQEEKPTASEAFDPRHVADVAEEILKKKLHSYLPDAVLFFPTIESLKPIIEEAGGGNLTDEQVKDVVEELIRRGVLTPTPGGFYPFHFTEDDALKRYKNARVFQQIRLIARLADLIRAFPDEPVARAYLTHVREAYDSLMGTGKMKWNHYQPIDRCILDLAQKRGAPGWDDLYNFRSVSDIITGAMKAVHKAEHPSAVSQDEIQRLIWETNTTHKELWQPNWSYLVFIKDKIKELGDKIPAKLKPYAEEFIRAEKAFREANRTVEKFRRLMDEAVVGRHTFTPEEKAELERAVRTQREALEKMVELKDILWDELYSIPPEAVSRDLQTAMETNRVSFECVADGKALPFTVEIPPFPYESAVNSYSINRMVPENAAEVDRRSYYKAVIAYAREAEKYCSVLGADRVKSLIRSFAENWLKRYEDYLTSLARVPAAHVVGPARGLDQATLNKRLDALRKKEKALASFYDEAIKNLKKWAEEAKRRTGETPYSAEIVELEEELARWKRWHEVMKEANRIIRSRLPQAEKERRLRELGIYDVVAKAGLHFFWPEPDDLGRVGFPSFELESVRGKIKRLEKRIEELKAKAEETKGTGMEVVAEGDGWKVIKNFKDDRVWVVFSAVPPAEVRSDLKARAFKWSPKRKAWVRKLTDNAVYDALKIIEKHYNVSGLTKKLERERIERGLLKDNWKQVWSFGVSAFVRGLDKAFRDSGYGVPELVKKEIKWESETTREADYTFDSDLGPFVLHVRLGHVSGTSFLAFSAKTPDGKCKVDGPEYAFPTGRKYVDEKRAWAVGKALGKALKECMVEHAPAEEKTTEAPQAEEKPFWEREVERLIKEIEELPIQKALKRKLIKMARLYGQYLEVNYHAKSIAASSGVGQAPPIYHRLIDKEIKLEDKFNEAFSDASTYIIKLSAGNTSVGIIAKAKGLLHETFEGSRLPIHEFPKLVEATREILTNPPLLEEKHKAPEAPQAEEKPTAQPKPCTVDKEALLWKTYEAEFRLKGLKAERPEWLKELAEKVCREEMTMAQALAETLRRAKVDIANEIYNRVVGKRTEEVVDLEKPPEENVLEEVEVPVEEHGRVEEEPLEEVVEEAEQPPTVADIEEKLTVAVRRLARAYGDPEAFVEALPIPELAHAVINGRIDLEDAEEFLRMAIVEGKKPQLLARVDWEKVLGKRGKIDIYRAEEKLLNELEKLIRKLERELGRRSRQEREQAKEEFLEEQPKEAQQTRPAPSSGTLERNLGGAPPAWLEDELRKPQSIWLLLDTGAEGFVNYMRARHPGIEKYYNGIYEFAKELLGRVEERLTMLPRKPVFAQIALHMLETERDLIAARGLRGFYKSEFPSIISLMLHDLDGYGKKLYQLYRNRPWIYWKEAGGRVFVGWEGGTDAYRVPTGNVMVRIAGLSMLKALGLNPEEAVGRVQFEMLDEAFKLIAREVSG